MVNSAGSPRQFGPTDIIDIPPEHLFRRVRTMRYERGGAVYATDGLVGHLRHVVVDEAVGEAVALVVQVEETGREILVPLQAVEKTAGSAVYLTGSCRQFADWAVRAPVYQRKHAAKADLKALLRDRMRYARDPRRTILQAGRDFLETAAPTWSAQAPTPPMLALVPAHDRPSAGASSATREPADARDGYGRMTGNETYR